jgi:hypothetical protein
MQVDESDGDCARNGKPKDTEWHNDSHEADRGHARKNDRAWKPDPFRFGSHAALLQSSGRVSLARRVGKPGTKDREGKDDRHGGLERALIDSEHSELLLQARSLEHANEASDNEARNRQSAIRPTVNGSPEVIRHTATLAPGATTCGAQVLGSDSR